MKCKNCGKEIKLRQSFIRSFKTWCHVESGADACRTYAEPTESEATQ